MDYLIVYNHQQSIYSPEQIHQVITSLPITDWWHYLPNVYIVRSSHHEKILSDGIMARNPGLLFLIIEVNLGKTDGVLNKNAWEWIKDKSKSVFSLQPTPSPNLLSQILNQPIPQNNIQKTPYPELLSSFLKKK